MGFGKIEMGMLSLILACVSYLYLESNDGESLTKSRATAEDAVLSNLPEEVETVHSIREECKSMGLGSNQLLLDLTTPPNTSTDGDAILDHLFNVRT